LTARREVSCFAIPTPLIMSIVQPVDEYDENRRPPRECKMGDTVKPPTRRVSLAYVLLVSLLMGAGPEPPALGPQLHLRVQQAHAWRPPFGLDRVGQSVVAVIESAGPPPSAEYALRLLNESKEIARIGVRFPATPPYSARRPRDGATRRAGGIIPTGLGASASTAR
jgi:hypothetical protein